MIQLSIIILSYNTKELVIECIQSILDHYKDQFEKDVFEIILLDNASTDNSAKEIEKKFDKAKNFLIVKSESNNGFSKGNNIGARKAKGKYLLFLNSDTVLLDKGLNGMVEYMGRHSEIGVLGGKLENENGTSQNSAGRFFNIINTFLTLFFGDVRYVRFSPLKDTVVDWVSGASMMVRRDIFEKIGGFDEKFFMYMEDMEFCFRMKKNGYATCFCPNVKIVHREQGSSNREFAIINIYKGIIYFYKKHKNYVQYMLVKLLLVAKACIAIAVGIFTHDTHISSTYRKALSLVL